MNSTAMAAQAAPAVAGKTLLKVENLSAWYAESRVLHGMNFDLREGELLTLIGRNGAGKTTTLRSIMGIVKKRTGSIQFQNKETISRRTFEIARMGIGYCPEERAIFSSLSVRENLFLPPVLQPGGMTDEALYTTFPNLKARASSQGTKLSGGEQQMLAIARILRTGAKLLLLDEPTEGLAPVIVEKIGETIRMLQQRGFTILMVEQNFRFASRVADRFYVIEEGRVGMQFDRDAIATDRARIEAILGL